MKGKHWIKYIECVHFLILHASFANNLPVYLEENIERSYDPLKKNITKIFTIISLYI